MVGGFGHEVTDDLPEGALPFLPDLDDVVPRTGVCGAVAGAVVDADLGGFAALVGYVAVEGSGRSCHVSGGGGRDDGRRGLDGQVENDLVFLIFRIDGAEGGAVAVVDVKGNLEQAGHRGRARDGPCGAVDLKTAGQVEGSVGGYPWGGADGRQVIGESLRHRDGHFERTGYDAWPGDAPEGEEG